ncbi:hypothetical protein HGP28_08755 [Vibrio sp. SM6]|uniref:Uncharacterized protein n=1 Tax=Vibrio agarilyticus TaxID=2726741 RepID=A0A7X8TQN2_9VIBR|nr:hypothetical protein [Vibrio agarilyticus]NLS12979.1 hypothetical protein [Vibrio agarilyticus]
MAEVIAHILLVGGNQFAYRVGRLLIAIMTLGNLSIEPLPKHFATHFTQAFDDNEIIREEDHAKYAVSYEKALTIGYIVLLAGLCAIIFVFRDYFIDTK